MKSSCIAPALFCVLLCGGSRAGQVPRAAAAAEIPISHQDRVYAAEQFSNTVSVIDPADNRLLGVIRLGEPQPANFSPLYRGEVLVHGLGFSPDSHTLAVVSIGSNSVSFIDTETNTVQHTTYIGRSPHEAFFTPDGSTVWVTVRGEDYVAILDAHTYQETARLHTPNGPGMTIFSPDGRLAYVCSSFVPELDVFEVQSRRLVGKVTQPSPFCPNLTATPDGTQVWFTLKDVGKTAVIQARPPFKTLKVLDTGPITNHVNIVRNRDGQFAYITVGGLNQVQIYRTDDYSLVERIPVGNLPHGVWPSGDGSRVYVGLENADRVSVIDTVSRQVLTEIAIGQAPQALVYVPKATSAASPSRNLQPLGTAASSTDLRLAPILNSDSPPSTVALFDQGLVQVMQAAVTGLMPKQPYVLALSSFPDGSGTLQPLQAFTTNPAGAAIVTAAGPIRLLMERGETAPPCILVVAPGTPSHMERAVLVQKR